MSLETCRRFLLSTADHLTGVREEARGLTCVADIAADLEFISSSPDNASMKSLIDEFRANKPQSIASLLTHVAGSSTHRSTVHRGDWLFAEQRTVFSLNGLAWVAMMATEQFGTSGRNWEVVLSEFCSRVGADAHLGAALNSGDQRSQVDAVMAIVLAVIRYLRAEFDLPSVGDEAELVALHEAPKKMHFWPPVLPSDEEKTEDLDRVVSELREMPVFLGALLVGSFASDHKRDRFSDIDLHCFCTELPDLQMRDDLAERLNPPNGSDTFACFHSLGMPAMGVHMCYVAREAQEAYFRQLHAEGRERPFINFSNKAFATSGYYWSTGKILDDPDGTLASFRQRASDYPSELQQAVLRQWMPIWQQHKDTFQEAVDRDRLASLTSLSICTEAAVRILLAQNRIYCNPLEPKWIPQEVANLSEETRALLPSLDLLPQGDESQAERFRKLEKIMQ
jgi:hypothetical protein